MNKIFVAVLATFMYVATPHVATAGEAGSWYLSPMYTFTDEDKDRLTGNGDGLRIGVGHMISSKWAIEAVAHGDQFNGFIDYDQWGVGADVLRMVDLNTAKLKPYIVFGAEYLVSQLNDPTLDDPDNFAANVGFGAMYPLAKKLYLRSDLRYRRDFASIKNFDDVQFNLGVAIPFGSSHADMDGDKDGVMDSVDVCPTTPMGVAVDARGCERDTDGDGVKDSNDRCPNTPAGTKVGNDGCAVVTTNDSDGDGVSDKMDRCPGTPAGATVDPTGCELDADNDGVVNRNDRCPATRAGARVDVNGCEIRDKISLPGVNFSTNAAALTPDSLAVLDAAAATLKKNPELVVEVAGHTDSVGNSDYNLALSQRRAEAVRQYLIASGVNGANISARGYGQTEPVADNATAEGRRRNRRVALRILN